MDNNINLYEFKGVGLKGKEKKRAHKQFEEYRKNYHIENFSDLKLLEDLVFRARQQAQYKEKIAELSENEKVKEAGVIPYKILQAYDANEKAILDLKDKLGLFDRRNKEDAFQHIQSLKKRYEKFCEKNQGSRTLICPHCSKMVLLKIRTDKWDAQKHPFFRDRILTNDYLMDLYKREVLTAEDVAKVLGVSPDYVTDFLLPKYYSNDDKQSGQE